MRWYWWVAVGIGLFLLVDAVLVVTSFINFLHTAN